MKPLLFRLLDLRAGEGPLFCWFFLYKAFWGAAVALGGAAGESLFIKGWGVQTLPVFFIAGDLLVMAGAAGHTRLSGRLGPGPMFRLILGVFAGLAALITFVFASGLGSTSDGSWVSFLAYLGFYVLVELAWLHFFNYQRRYLDLQQSKRLLPRILGGYSAGFVVGGLGVILLLRVASVTALLAAWTLALVGAMFALEMLGRRVRPAVEAPRSAAVGQKPPALRELLKHPLAVWILGFTTLSVFAMRLFEFQANAEFTRIFPTGDDLAGFYGAYSAGARIFGLFVQLSLMPWAIGLLGVARSGIVYPVFAALSGTALAFSPGLWPAMGARFCHSCLVYTVADPLLTLLASGMPAALADRVNVLAVGWVMRLATVVVSLIMLALAHAGLTGVVGTVSFVLAWALLALVLPLRHLYSRAVLDTVQGGQGAGHPLERMDLSALPDDFYEELRKHVREPEPVVAAMAVELLARCRRPSELRFLAGLLAEPGAPELKARIYATLPVEESPELRRLLELGIASEDPGVRAAALRALGRVDGPAAAPRLLPLLPHPEARLRAAASAWLVADSRQEARAAGLLPGLVGDPDPGVVRAVLEAFAERRPDYGLPLVLHCATHSDAGVREAALVAATHAGRFQEAPVLRLVAGLVEDRVAAVRLAAVRAVSAFPGEEAASLCARALADPSRAVARAAGDALLRMGAAGLRAAWACASSAACPAVSRHNALVALASARRLSLVAKAGERWVSRGLRLAALRGELGGSTCASPAEALLASLLEERLRDSALLGAHAIVLLRQSDIYGVLERRLTSADHRLQAHALEALNNLGEQQLTPRVQLLLEVREPSGRAAAARELLCPEAPPALGDAAVVLERDGDPYLLAGWQCLAAEKGWGPASAGPSQDCRPFDSFIPETARWARSTA